MRLFEGTPLDRPPRCESCGELEENCQCPPPPPPQIPPGDQTAHVSVEKRKRGKHVTLVRGLPSEGNDLPMLLTQLKVSCGAGGTLKDGVIEIQGEQKKHVSQTLKAIGYRVRG